MKATKTESALMIGGGILGLIALWLVGTQAVRDSLGGSLFLSAAIIVGCGWISFARHRALPRSRKQWSLH
jgi:hypothetical protein